MDLSMNAAPRVPLLHAEWSSQTPESLLVHAYRVNSKTHEQRPPTAALPSGQANRLAVLLDALDGVPLSDGERASLAWLALAGFEMRTVADIAAVITCARRSAPARQ